MNNFDFYNPTHIVFGKDRVKDINNLVPKDARVLVLYGGGSVKRFGTLERVKEALDDRAVFEFSGIEPNPKYETLIKAVDIIKKENIDFLLPVGGGSVIDGTKFISLACNYDGDLTDLLLKGVSGKIKKAIPIGTVLTLPATGSEMNSGGVITYDKGKFVIGNPLVFPKFSILEPEITFTLPESQVANGVVDTFIHVVEQYVTYPVDARFQDRTAEGILKTLIEIGKDTIDNPKDYDLRANLVLCATMGLNGLIKMGVPEDWSTHMIGHELTALYGIDHGKTLAVVQPASWSVRKNQKREKLVQYAERVFDIKDGDKDTKIEMAINKTREFFESLGVKTKLSDYGLDKKNIDEVINSLEKHGLLNLGENGDVTLEVSREILNKAL
ncbi:iron-containing alcohol dehydrogenase [Clostridium sp. Ade.TY]|uniref:iron-containing alcohol dehydrogenase n=1 Tax=Clostridium sp. Ade.TY TaxID=1391647 RepID=UPI0004654F73|nr:iron-containing alcohol dehydrogenase [Clostridium sp. Ade.TY]